MYVGRIRDCDEVNNKWVKADGLKMMLKQYVDKPLSLLTFFCFIFYTTALIRRVLLFVFQDLDKQLLCYQVYECSH